MARLKPVTGKEDVAKEHHDVVDAVVKSRGAVQGPFKMLLHCPPLAAHMVNVGGYIRFEGKLDHRVRVLAAMVVAREFDAVYVWGAQTGQARKRNVPESTITAIREKHSKGVPPEDAQIIDATRDLLSKHRLSKETFDALRKRFGSDEQLIEFTGTVGYYSMLCMTVNTCELEAAEGAEVLQEPR